MVFVALIAVLMFASEISKLDRVVFGILGFVLWVDAGIFVMLTGHTLHSELFEIAYNEKIMIAERLGLAIIASYLALKAICNARIKNAKIKEEESENN